ncbi:Uma2 family endonuclease [Alienimonas californiensis]|uniref:Putative restriction endonuclease domain-containing protein n=1 Tax=Alienimonas californiensis TaxID=2527989 RepID=A0A517P7M8_9PLAN|nr:Uma2 family endonuclease [Alienimonas californiensis]QDT15363.1 hypothetical protein CA12_14480 [Alienimonas californiensis]
MALLADSPPLAAPAVRRGSTAPVPPRDRVTAPAPAGRCVLAGANWEMYRRLRDEPANARFKLTYDGPSGRLEIEMPQGPLHESVARLIAYFVMAFRQSGGPRFRATGGVTLGREDLDRGLECDESFYISSLDDAPDLDANTLDLSSGALPPDLAIEVDVTSPGVEKLPIYAALGVPEVWVWNAADGSLAAHRLSESGGYAVTADSVELPGFPLAVAAELIRTRGDRDDGELQAAFAERLRQVSGEDNR